MLDPLSILHLRKILSEPEPTIEGINHNSDTNDVATGGQDILAMAVIGWLLVHHILVETQRAIDGLIAGYSNIFCGPRPVDALLSLAVAEERLSRQLV